jgi:hypothetical protein
MTANKKYFSRLELREEKSRDNFAALKKINSHAA